MKEAQQVSVLTIYSPCEIQNKRLLWDQVKQLKQSLLGDLWCILGDFNSIRDLAERFGICQRGSGPLKDLSNIQQSRILKGLGPQQSGWGGYVLKEKIKTLKQALKKWNKEHFGDTFKRVKRIEEELSKLEEETSHRQLSTQEGM